MEVSRMSFSVAQKVGELLTSEKPYSQIGGCGLIIDYGADHAFSDSLRVGGFAQNFNMAEILSDIF